MKQLFAILVLMVIINTVKSQVAVFPTVGDIATHSDTSTTAIFVKDTLRGGQFLLYSGSDPTDNGMIFTDGLSRKWIRQLDARKDINLAWYGLSESYTTSDSYNYNAFMAALDYVTNHKLSCDIIFPAGIYKFNQTITIDTSVSLKGNGKFYNWKTVLVFPVNITGFRLKTTEGSLLNTVADIMDLLVRADANYFDPSSLTLDSTKHAFDISCIVHLTNVDVEGWAGDGFHINACAIPGYPNFGNSDNSYLLYCGANLCNNGIKLDGCDANIITIHNGNWTLNRRWGIWDHGFLGNNYQKNHFAYNGVYKSFCSVYYAGGYYCAVNPDSVLNINRRPDLYPALWDTITFVPYTVNTWNDSTKYWSGGVSFIESPNNFSLILGNYSEEAQPPARHRGRAISIGGDNGSGVTEGAFIESNDGLLRIKNVGLLVERADGNPVNTETVITNGFSSGININNEDASLQINPVQIGVGTSGRGISFIYETQGQFLKAGTPFVYDKLGFFVPGSDGYLGSVSLNVAKPSSAHSQTGNTNYRNDETIIHASVYGAEANSFAWKPDANGDVPSTLGAENFIAQITPHQKDYTSTNDTWTRFYYYNLGYDADKMVMKYTVSILATTTAGDMWSEERKIVFKKASGLAPVEQSNDLIGTSTKDSALSAADFRFTFNGTGFNLELKGLSGTNVHWVVTLTKEVNVY